MLPLKSEVWRAVFCPQLSNAALSQGSRFNDFSTACFVKAYWTVGPLARVSANAIAVDKILVSRQGFNQTGVLEHRSVEYRYPHKAILMLDCSRLIWAGSK